jgi:hypothetical protein
LDVIEWEKDEARRARAMIVLHREQDAIWESMTQKMMEDRLNEIMPENMSLTLEFGMIVVVGMVIPLCVAGGILVTRKIVRSFRK